MIQFLRRWYVLVAVVWLLGGIAAMWFFAMSEAKNHPQLFWPILLATFIVPATLLASCGLKETTIAKVAVSLYAVVFVPTGLFALCADAMENALQGWLKPHWSNTWFWFQLMLEGGFLAAPVVLAISAGIAFGVNLFAASEIGNAEIIESEREKNSGLIIDPILILASTATPPFQPAAALAETPTIFLHDGAVQTGPFTLTQVQGMLSHGEISAAFSYWSEGMEQWQSVTDLSSTPM